MKIDEEEAVAVIYRLYMAVRPDLQFTLWPVVPDRWQNCGELHRFRFECSTLQCR